MSSDKENQHQSKANHQDEEVVPSMPMILDDMEVLATLRRVSAGRSFTAIAKLFSIYDTASVAATRNPNNRTSQQRTQKKC